MSNTPNAQYSFLMPNRIALTDEQRAALLDQEHLPCSISINDKVYWPLSPVDSGHKGVVWRVRDGFSRLRAVKLCIYDDYQDRSYLEEASRASKLEPYREFARFIDAGLVELSIGPLPRRKFVVFVEEWIEGVTLAKFVGDNRDPVSSSLLLAYVAGLANALNALQTLGLRHDDLHASNVMLAHPVAGDLDPEWSVKIIDTGSLKLADSPQNKPKDDHRHFVDHLVLLWNALRARKPLTVRDRRFLQTVRGLLQSMLEDEPGIALREPAQIATQFRRAYTRANSPRFDQPSPPVSPFEFISAEHIADDRLLVRMFARSCPFLEKVDGPDPCLVTGPRGCGKSTLFRWLSLKAHLHENSPGTRAARIAGFYVSCSSDLQNKLGWIETDAIANRFKREIIHYFNLLLAREVIQTLATIAERDDREIVWGLGVDAERAIWQFIVERLSPTSSPRVQGVSRLVQAAELIEDELVSTHRKMVRRRNLVTFTSQAFLGELTSLLTTRVSYFRAKPITFLIDDFSSHRIAVPVQIVLNQVIWERRSSHIFKLSSEKYGAALIDSLGATVDVSREMIEIDCGREYIALDDSSRVSRAREFAVELLNNRLSAAGYVGDSETLIGPSNWPNNSLARALASKGSGRVLDQYHGLDCIAAVCSGDVSTLLLVYRRIFEGGAVTNTSTDRISKATQHTAIVSVSRELYELIRHYVPHGPQMYKIVGAFGTLVRNALQHATWHKKGPGTTPVQCPRIELDQTADSTEDEMTAGQRDLAQELVRRAIFIEMEPGLSRHGNVTTLRWHLRRVYLPAFNAALAKNDAVKESINWLKYFLTNPNEACKDAWAKRSKDVDRTPQPKLF